MADITYIRLQVEFVYLAVLLDAFSRRCIGWALQRTLEAALVLEALRIALRQRRPQPGLVHHSHRGVQYAAQDYRAQLEQRGIRSSMSRVANPYDNARAESFIKTLKYEEVYRTEYRNLQEAKASIGEFLEKLYNQERLHSALGYRPPLGSSEAYDSRQRWGKDELSFLRHEEIYRSDVGLGKAGSSNWCRSQCSSASMSFQLAISWQVAPPAEPASASPTGNDSQQPILPYNVFSANGNNPLNFVSQPKGALQDEPSPGVIPIRSRFRPVHSDSISTTPFSRKA